MILIKIKDKEMRNWISLKLPVNIREWLNKETLSLKEFISSTENNKNKSEIKEESQTKETPLDFYPMNFDDLHLTLVFCSDYFKKLNHEQIKKVNNILQEFQNTEFNLIFNMFELFPPGKQNLIVAKFTLDLKTNKKVIQLRKQLFSVFGVAKPEENIKDFTEDYERDFIPHITLGKIKGYNPKKHNVDLLKYNSEALKTEGLLNVNKFTTSGTYMCGDNLSYIKF
jgi:2'-5' RNA ligase